MTGAVSFVLSFPWGLHALTDVGGRRIRQRLDHGATVEVDARHGLVIAAPASMRLRFLGRRMREQAEGLAFPWSETRFQLSAIPAGVHKGEQRLHLQVGESEHDLAVVLEVHDHLLKQVTTSAQSRETPDSAEALATFILDILARIREAEPTMNGQLGEEPVGHCSRWDRLADVWLSQEAVPEVAPKELIVDHAEHLMGPIADVARHPRRILARTRELMPIDRIQELDTACVEWLVRQRGITVEEKAGQRQELMGIARHESLNTLENRVLKAFLRLSSEKAATYLRANRRFVGQERTRLVRRYQALSHSLFRDLQNRGIGDPVPPVSPNYVLQHDARYWTIWKAYRELLADKDKEDDLWRWQRRLWADFVRLAVVVALRRLPGCRSVALAPLRLRRDQANGRWTDMSQQLAGFHLRRRGRDFAILAVDSTLNVHHPVVDPWHHRLGATAVLRVTECDTNQVGSVVIWAIHGTAADPVPLSDLVASAGEAMTRALLREEEDSDRQIRSRGLVVRSCLTQDATDMEAGNPAYGISFGPRPDSVQQGLVACSEIIEETIDRLFP